MVKLWAEILSGNRIFLFYNRRILQYSYYYYCFIIEEYSSILTQKWSFNPHVFFFCLCKYQNQTHLLFLSSSSSWSLASLYLIDILETLVWPPLSWLLRTFSSLGELLCGFHCLYFEKCDQGDLNISFCFTKLEMKLQLIPGSRPLTSLYLEHSMSKSRHCHFFLLRVLQLRTVFSKLWEPSVSFFLLRWLIKAIYYLNMLAHSMTKPTQMKGRMRN